MLQIRKLAPSMWQDERQLFNLCGRLQHIVQQQQREAGGRHSFVSELFSQWRSRRGARSHAEVHVEVHRRHQIAWSVSEEPFFAASADS